VNDWPSFPKAPITEAIFDIRVVLPQNTDIEVLSKYEELIPNHYDKKKEQKFFSGHIKLPENNVEPEFQSKPSFKGNMYFSSEEQKVIQAQVDGFSFSKLRPYESWDDFFNEARELWSSYKNLIQPSHIVRIALRYINRIEIPLGFKDFEEYILTNPKISDKLPQGISSFLMRIEMPKPEINAIAIITQTMEKPYDNKVPLIMDIDTIINNKHELSGGFSEDIIWKDFVELRNFKNELFFQSITEKTKELFK